jgi:hypothetical protein
VAYLASVNTCTARSWSPSKAPAPQGLPRPSPGKFPRPWPSTLYSPMDWKSLQDTDWVLPHMSASRRNQSLAQQGSQKMCAAKSKERAAKSKEWEGDTSSLTSLHKDGICSHTLLWGKAWKEFLSKCQYPGELTHCNQNGFSVAFQGPEKKFLIPSGPSDCPPLTSHLPKVSENH